MFKIKYYNRTSSPEDTKRFNSYEGADTHLQINGFRFNRDKNAYDKKRSTNGDEAVIVEC